MLNETIADSTGFSGKIVFDLAPIGATACRLGLQPQVNVIFF